MNLTALFTDAFQARPRAASVNVPADWTKALAVNVKGNALGIKHASLVMSQQPRWSSEGPDNDSEKDAWPYAILNIASMMSYRAAAQMAPYCTTKGATVQLTKSCALDLARHKIRYVHARCGFIWQQHWLVITSSLLSACFAFTSFQSVYMYNAT